LVRFDENAATSVRNFFCSLWTVSWCLRSASSIHVDIALSPRPSVAFRDVHVILVLFVVFVHSLLFVIIVVIVVIDAKSADGAGL
jgi:hypothetical protein